jgi:hypothetical protein
MPLFIKPPTPLSPKSNSMFIKPFEKHFSGVVTTPRFSKTLSKSSRECSHPRVFGSTISFPKDIDANHQVSSKRGVE